MDDDAKYVSTPNQEFGDARGFWNRYEELAGSNDRDLSNDLNANLDTLLIFAGLFSAINTAFISFTMPSLSPGMLDRTNTLLELVLRNNSSTIPQTISPPFSPDAITVVANCLLYASLCCSLLAAAGAMLGKEWLRNFDRKGQVASLGDQARLRQKKFRAVQKWYFRESIQLFPYTLLLSVVLFFAGLVPYLISINKAVAGVVIAFIACGISGWTFTICSCVLDPYSPYQTVLTYFIHNLPQKEGESQGIPQKGGESQGIVPDPDPTLQPDDTAVWSPQSPTSPPPWIGINNERGGDGVVPFDSATGYDGSGPGAQVFSSSTPGARLATPTGGTLDLARRGTKVQLFPDETEKHALNAETVNWLLGTTSKPEDLLIVAQNLCCLEFKARKVILRDSASWQRLLHFALDALQHWRDRPDPKTDNRLRAEYLGAALCRLLIDEPRDGAKWEEVRQHFKEKFFQPSKSSAGQGLSLSVLKSVLITNATTRLWQDDLKEAEYDLRKIFLQTQISESRTERWSILVGAVKVQYDDVILNLLAALIFARSKLSRDPSDLQKLAIEAYNGESLVKHLLNALTAHEKVFGAVQNHPRQLDALSEIYAAFMQKVEEYCRYKPADIDPQLLESLRQSLTAFILGLVERVDVSERCSLTWIQSVMKAVATARVCKIDIASRKAICEALKYIIEGSRTCDPEMDEVNLQQFTLPTLNAIAQDFSALNAESLGNDPGIVLCLVSAIEGVDREEWLEFFAKNPPIWMPTNPDGNKEWKESGFIPQLLKGFKETSQSTEQEALATIMVHIAKSGSPDWCAQMIMTPDGLAQVLKESIGSEGPAHIPVTIILRPLLKVFARHQIDWGTDLMYGIVEKLSASIAVKDSELLRQLKRDSEVDIETLIAFIKHVKSCRTYDGSSLGTIEKALERLSEKSQSRKR